jgi:uroporphyrinogen-III decarboxylase
MKITEYDEMLADPNGFAVKKLWPRISSTLAPMSSIMQAPPLPLFSMSNAYTLPFLLGGLISQPHIRELLEKALALADESVKGMKNMMSYVMEMRSLGYPIQWTAAAFPPFDWVSNSLRGLKGSSTDMFRAPEKLLATIEMISAMTIGGLAGQAQQGQSKGVCIFMHRGADVFMSKKQFEKFYWPSFRSLLLGLVDAGLTPIALFEGDYTSRLEFLQEFPAGKIVGHFDRIDRKKAKKLIGDVMCFWGNIPASLMVSGTPQQVKDDVKELIDIFGDNGGLIIDSINGFPDESRPENVQAVTEAAHEFGVY